jgi:acetyl esterase
MGTPHTTESGNRPPFAPEVENLIARLTLRASAAPGPIDDIWRQDARKEDDRAFLEAGGTLPQVGGIADRRIAVPNGAITLRVYTPPGTGPWPAFIHFHGGAFMFGSIDWLEYDAKCRYLCQSVGCVVVAPEYRLAPEHPYPAAIDDAYASVKWLQANAEQLDVDAGRVAVGGDSAGANLSAVVCLMARDRGEPLPRLQVLEIPAVDLATMLEWPSAKSYGSGFGLALEGGELDRAYLAGHEPWDPYVSPVHAPDLLGLPAAHVMTAEFDPFRDAGEAYAARLREAGVQVTCTRHMGHIHSSGALPNWPPAECWRDEIACALRRAFSESEIGTNGTP